MDGVGVGASLVYNTNTSRAHIHTNCHNLLTPILTYYLVARSLEATELQAFLAAMENIKWFGSVKCVLLGFSLESTVYVSRT